MSDSQVESLLSAAPILSSYAGSWSDRLRKLLQAFVVGGGEGLEILVMK